MINKTHTKYIQSLQHKKFRDESNLFIAEGPKVVLDLLASWKFNCKELFVLKDWFTANSKSLVNYTDISVTVIEEFELEKISVLATPHQVLAVFEKRKADNNIDLKDKIILVLDSVQDPGNLGTIIRIADWFGITDMICSIGCADMYNPKVVQSTMGSLARIHIFYTDLTNWLQENSTVKKYAADLDGKNIGTTKNIKEAIIIIGNEGKGISSDVMKLVDEKILNESILDKPIIAKTAYEADNYDWRYFCVANLY